MAGMDILSTVRGLFPDVTTAVDQYQATKSDRQARNLARRLGNEEALYHQFLSQLLLLSSAASAKSADEPLGAIESRLGFQSKAADSLRRDLHQMVGCLRDLKADLTNTSRGSELLAKLRWKKTSLRGALPRTPLQKRLDELSRVNRRLATYLLYGHDQAPLAVARDFQVTLNLRLTRRLRGLEQANSFQITGERFFCACEKEASGSTTYPSQQAIGSLSGQPLDYRDRNEDLFHLQHKSHHISVSVQNLDKPRDAYSSSGVGHKRCDVSHITKPGEDGTIFRLGIEDTTLPLGAIGFKDLLLRRRTSLGQKERMELAFRLSLAVLLLWGPSCAGNSPKWKDWTVWFDPEEDGVPSPYLSPKSQLGQESCDGKITSSTEFPLFAREPALSLLGIRLIELAFGQTFSEVRRDHISLLSREEEQDRDSIDLLAAKKLVSLNRIAQKFGQSFEDVVNVCLNQQYRERKGARIIELNLQDQYFLERAAVSILLPLYHEMRKGSGCTCYATPLHGPRAAFKNEYLEPVENDSQKDDDYLIPSISGNLSFPPSRNPDEPVEDKAFRAKSTPSRNRLSGPSLATEGVNEGFQSHESPQPGQWPISVVSNEDSGSEAASICSHETMTATTDSAFALLSDHTEDPLDISEDHPLLLFQDVALRIMLRAFRSWRECGNGGNYGARSVPSVFSQGGGPSRKRARAGGGRSQREENDDEDDEPSQGIPGTSNKKQRTKEETLTFACPFFKKNFLAYNNCSGYVLSRIRDVKQHLGRRHQMPLYCPRCNQIFRDEEDRDAHVRDGGCEQRPPQKPEGITEAQRKQLAKKAPPSQLPEQQWFGIFDMLFPDHQPRPESPYIDRGLLQNVLAYQSFVNNHGPRILNNILVARGAVTWHLPAGESDMQAFQHRILGEGTRALLDEWTSRGGVAAPESNTVNSTATGQGRSNQHRISVPSVESATNEDADRQSVDTSYFTTSASSYAPSSDSAQISWHGPGPQDPWFSPQQLDNMGGDGFGHMPFDQGMMFPDEAESEEISRITMNFQNHNMGGYR